MMAVNHSRDSDGRETVLVPLSNSPSKVVLYKADYEALAAHFRETRWFLNGDGKGRFYVRIKCPVRRNNVMAARIIADADGGGLSFVRLRDDNPLNLRSTNFDRLRAGTQRARDFVERACSRHSKPPQRAPARPLHALP